MAEYANLPISFEANIGQADSTVEFLAHGRNGNLLLTRSEAWLALQKNVKGGDPQIIGLKLSGANTDPRVEGVDPMQGRANYFTGNDPAGWHTGAPMFARVKYHDVYPGVDLIYYGNQQKLEYDLVVQPGANPNNILLQFTGVENISLDAGGDLLLGPANDSIRQHKPVVYQEIGGERKMLAGSYVLHSAMEVGFEIAGYDKTKPLIIDPVLSYSATFGGGGLSQSLGIALDGNDNVYITGNTTSGNFSTLNPLQAGLLGSQAAFVTKLDTNGDVVFSTYLGGGVTNDTTATATSGQGITVDDNGDVYVCGYTSATNFPTQNPLQSTNAGPAVSTYDAFVTEINSNGNSLVYSTYLGGSGNESANGIALDTNGDAIITGWTTSSNFPVASAMQPVYAGGFGINGYNGGDAFVAKLTADGSALVYSTYLGGGSSENMPLYETNPALSGGAVAVDFSGNAFVTGWTYSTNFPVLNAYQPTNAAVSSSYSAAFVTELDPSGNLVYSTYFAGKNGDFGRAIGVDFNDNVYFAGNDDLGGLPVTNALQSSFGGHGFGNEVSAGDNLPVGDGFVAALDSTGTNLIYSTYLGGSGDDQVNGIAVRPEDGAVAVTGFTDSPNFPQLNAVQSTGEQGFFTSSNAASVWNVSSPVPGNGIIYEIHVDPSNPLVIYVLAGFSSGYAGTYKSTDGGQTWAWMSSAGLIPAPVSGSSNGNTIASIMAIDPLNPQTLYVASGGNFYKTVNGETNWNYITSLSGGPIQSLAIDPVTTTTLYAGLNSGGIYKSTNGGTTWTLATNGLSNLDIQAVLVDPQNSSNLYAGAGGAFDTKQSLFKSTNAGASWTLTTNGLPSVPVAGLFAHAGTIYAILGDTFESAYLFSSTDGLNWSQVVADNALDFTALAFGAASGGLPVLTIGRSGSSDVMSWPASFTGFTLQTSLSLNPSGWQNVSQSPVTNNGIITVTIPMSGSQGFYRLTGTNSMAYSPPAIYLGTDQFSKQGLLKSTDGGATWNSVGFAGNTINALAVNPANPATVYAGLNRGRDAFVTTLTPAGQLYFSSFIGGGGADQGNTVAFDNDLMDVYVAASSSSSDFPTTAAPPAPAALNKLKITPDDVKPLDTTPYQPKTPDGVAVVQKPAVVKVKAADGCPQSVTYYIPRPGQPPIHVGAYFSLTAFEQIGAVGLITTFNGSVPGTEFVDNLDDNFLGQRSAYAGLSGTPTQAGTFTVSFDFGYAPGSGGCSWVITYIITISN